MSQTRSMLYVLCIYVPIRRRKRTAYVCMFYFLCIQTLYIQDDMSVQYVCMTMFRVWTSTPNKFEYLFEGWNRLRRWTDGVQFSLKHLLPVCTRSIYSDRLLTCGLKFRTRIFFEWRAVVEHAKDGRLVLCVRSANANIRQTPSLMARLYLLNKVPCAKSGRGIIGINYESECRMCVCIHNYYCHTLPYVRPLQRFLVHFSASICNVHTNGTHVECGQPSQRPLPCVRCLGWIDQNDCCPGNTLCHRYNHVDTSFAEF